LNKHGNSIISVAFTLLFAAMHYFFGHGTATTMEILTFYFIFLIYLESK